MYSYTYEKVKVRGKARVIAMENKTIGIAITLLNFEGILIKFIYDSQISLEFIKSFGNKKVRRSKLYYLSRK